MPVLIVIIAILLSITVPSNSRADNDNSYSITPAVSETAALNHIASVFNSDNGSVTLQRLSPAEVQMQDATMMIMDIRKRWNEWSPEFRKTASAYFLSKPLSDYNQSSQRMLMKGTGMVRSLHLLPNWIETAHFNIEWGNNLGSRDSGTDSTAVVSCSADFRTGEICSGIPDFVDKWADYLEEVWAVETIQLGYIRPAGTDTYLYDVYIANTKDTITGNGDDITPALSYNYLGLTVTYCDKDVYQICKEDYSQEQYSYIVVNNAYPNDNTMKITAAHELFHAIQFTYPSIDDWWYTPDDHWWIEATATWMEEVVYDESNHYYPRVISWLRNPELSLKNTATSYSGHEYGDVLFILYLTDVHLNNRDFVRDVWESGRSGLDALDGVLSMWEYGYNDFESVFKGFVALNAVADIGEVNGGYEEGSQYGRASVVRKHGLYPAEYSVSSLSAPHELGSNYIQFIPPDNTANRLTIEFNGSDGVNWATMLVKVRSDGTGFERVDMAIDHMLKSGCQAVEGFGSVFSEVFLVASVLVDPALVGSAPYSYKAAIGGDCPDAPPQAIAVARINDSAEQVASDKRCFIATAAFGSSESVYVQILRDFRDRYLLKFSLGRHFVLIYYSVSPSIAEIMDANPILSVIARYYLYPVIGVAFVVLNTTVFVKLLFAATLLSIPGLFCLRSTHSNN